MNVSPRAEKPAEANPAPVLSAALTQRVGSRGDEDFANKRLSAMRYAFGGHEEKIQRPRDLASLLETRAGIVEHGLFLGIATDVLVGEGQGVRHLCREGAVR